MPDEVMQIPPPVKKNASDKLYAKCRERGMSIHRAATIVRRAKGLSKFHDKPPEKYCETCQTWDACHHVAKPLVQPAVAKYAAKGIESLSKEQLAEVWRQILALDDDADPMGTLALPHAGIVTVWKIDGDAVKVEHDMDFVEAGNGYRWPFCPKDEIWIDEDLEPHDWPFNCIHEASEIDRMAQGEEYDTAHNHANRIEKAKRIEAAMNALNASMPCSECGKHGCDHTAEKVAKYCVEKYAMRKPFEKNPDRKNISEKMAPGLGRGRSEQRSRLKKEGKEIPASLSDYKEGTESRAKEQDKSAPKNPDFEATHPREEAGKPEGGEFTEIKIGNVGVHMPHGTVVLPPGHPNHPEDGTPDEPFALSPATDTKKDKWIPAGGGKQTQKTMLSKEGIPGQQDLFNTEGSEPEQSPVSGPVAEAAPVPPAAQAPAGPVPPAAQGPAAPVDPNTPSPGRSAAQSASIAKNGPPPLTMREARTQAAQELEETYKAREAQAAIEKERKAGLAANRRATAPKPKGNVALNNEADRKLQGAVEAGKIAPDALPTGTVTKPTEEQLAAKKAENKSKGAAKGHETRKANRFQEDDAIDRVKEIAREKGMNWGELHKIAVEAQMAATGPIREYNDQLSQLQSDLGISAKGLNDIENESAEGTNTGIDRTDNSKAGSSAQAIPDTFASEHEGQFVALGIRGDSTQDEIAAIAKQSPKPIPHWSDYIDSAVKHLDRTADPEGQGVSLDEPEGDFDVPWDEKEGFDDAEAALNEVTQAPHKTLNEEIAERQRQILDRGRQQQETPLSTATATTNPESPKEEPAPAPQSGFHISEPNEAKKNYHANIFRLNKEGKLKGVPTPEEVAKQVADLDAEKAKRGSVKTQTAQELRQPRTGAKISPEEYERRKKADVEASQAKHGARADAAERKEKAKAERLKISAEARARTKAFLQQAKQRASGNPELEKAIGQWLESLADAASPWWDMRNVAAGIRRHNTKTSNPGGRKAWNNR